MKNKFLFLGILITGLMFISDYQIYGKTPQKKTAALHTMKYTCPMHPQVIKDEPGKCTICGMTLVVNKELSNDTLPQMNDSMMMKHDHMRIMHDSTPMKSKMDNPKMMNKGTMMPDTTMMKVDQLRHDTTSMKLNRMNKK